MALFHNEKPKLTPKDFVLYAANMIALYVSVFAFLVLVFEYINFLFPDDALGYIDPYSTAMRSAIATLLVMFPLFIGLTRYTNQDLRSHPEKQELGFRKWLIYITLLAAGLTLVIDLIVLINSFLGGELTVSFTLKVLAVFAVVGAGFSYYVLLLKEYWQERESLSRIYGIVVALIVFGTIIGGFFIMGSPQDQRARKIDQERINDLSAIQWQVVEYWRDTGELPESLEALSDPLVFTPPEDPQTSERYGYEVEGDLTFALCATFQSEGATDTSFRYSSPTFGIDEGTWEHPAGEHCFTRTINPERFSGEGNKPLPVR